MIDIPQRFAELMQQYDQLRHLPDVLAGTDPVVSVRVNPHKGVNLPAGADAVAWWPQGAFYLPERPQFTFDPGLHQGLYYVQDASSVAMSAVVSHVVAMLKADGCERPLRYLDACAAPGGKTLAALDALPADASVVANEYDGRRAAVLAENVAKWGVGRVMVTRGDTSRFKGINEAFDIVAADAPCSGEGMMRKEPDAVAQWSEALVRECADRQRTILANVWEALRPGGVLIYSTCTFNTLENEQIVRWLVDSYDATPIELPLAGVAGVIGAVESDVSACRFLPGNVRGEGLFVAALRKPGDITTEARNRGRRSPQQRSKSILPQWLNVDAVERSSSDGIVSLVPAVSATFFDEIAPRLDVVACGTQAAEIRGRDIVPMQPLALSAQLKADAFDRVEVDYAIALAYLRRECPVLPDLTPKGPVLLTYRGHGLGFVKNLGRRTNSLYPRQWRIVSGHNPDHPVEILY